MASNYGKPLILISVEMDTETSSQVKEFISEEEAVRGREVWIGGAAGECLGGSVGSFWFLIWRTQFEVIGREGSFPWVSSYKRRVFSELF